MVGTAGKLEKVKEPEIPAGGGIPNTRNSRGDRAASIAEGHITKFGGGGRVSSNRGKPEQILLAGWRVLRRSSIGGLRICSHHEEGRRLSSDVL